MLMKALGERYVQYVNRRYSRTGTLWEGRYYSCLVQCERYLMACQRYVELNPVRASALWRAGATLSSHQPINAETHAVHAAAWSTAEGELTVVREDVGRADRVRASRAAS